MRHFQLVCSGAQETRTWHGYEYSVVQLVGRGTLADLQTHDSSAVNAHICHTISNYCPNFCLKGNWIKKEATGVKNTLQKTQRLNKTFWKEKTNTRGALIVVLQNIEKIT